jgi:hypothetical protein
MSAFKHIFQLTIHVHLNFGNLPPIQINYLTQNATSFVTISTHLTPLTLTNTSVQLSNSPRSFRTTQNITPESTNIQNQVQNIAGNYQEFPRIPQIIPFPRCYSISVLLIACLVACIPWNLTFRSVPTSGQFAIAPLSNYWLHHREKSNLGAQPLTQVIRWRCCARDYSSSARLFCWRARKRK